MEQLEPLKLELYPEEEDVHNLTDQEYIPVSRWIMTGSRRQLKWSQMIITIVDLEYMIN